MKRDGRDGKKPRMVEIRDKWFEDVPDLKTAYWLKEDFSDILQLWDRHQAEGRTDLWLRRVEEFVEDLRSRHRKKEGKKWDCPFANVLTTIRTWRPYILNYIDSKNIYSLTATNYFAEHVNKKIKRAKSLSNGISLETVRIKLVHGGVMVKRRPPHPLDEPRARAKSKLRSGPGKENGTSNPDSNLTRLKQAREDRDETKDLLPNPQESPGWVSRFGSLVRPDPGAFYVEPAAQKNVEASDKIPADDKRAGVSRRERTKSDANQLIIL